MHIFTEILEEFSGDIPGKRKMVCLLCFHSCNLFEVFFNVLGNLVKISSDNNPTMFLHNFLISWRSCLRNFIVASFIRAYILLSMGDLIVLGTFT